MSRSWAIITGGTSGIGLEAARQLLQRGTHHLVLASRNRERGESLAEELRHAHPGSTVTFMHLDLASLSSVRRFAEEFQAAHPQLHLLILNAGFGLDFIGKTAPQLTCDGLELTVGCNHVAHALLAQLLLPALRAAAPCRVVVVASEAHRTGAIDFSNLMLLNDGGRQYSGLRAYSNSKLMNIAFAVEFNRRYRAEGITAVAVHPGAIVSTGFFQRQSAAVTCCMRWVMPMCVCGCGGTQTVQQGGQALMAAAFADASAVEGTYFVVMRPRGTIHNRGSDPRVCADLWDATEKLIAAAGAGRVERPAGGLDAAVDTGAGAGLLSAAAVHDARDAHAHAGGDGVAVPAVSVSGGGGAGGSGESK